MPDEEVTELAHRVEAINDKGGLLRRFKRGEKVRVESRLVESLAEVIEDARSPSSRVKVLIQFMGRMVSAQVPREFLQPISEQAEIRLPVRVPRRTRGRGRWIRGFGPQPLGATEA